MNFKYFDELIICVDLIKKYIDSMIGLSIQFLLFIRFVLYFQINAG